MAELGGALRFLSAGLSEAESIPLDVLDDARLNHFGCRVDHAADYAFRADSIPNLAPGIHALESMIPPGAFQAIKVPPRYPVDAGDDRGLGTKERLDRFDDAEQGVSLESDDDVVLRPDFGGILPGPTQAVIALTVIG